MLWCQSKSVDLTLSFVTQTDERTGQSRRDVNRAVSCGDKIAGDVIEAASASPLSAYFRLATTAFPA